MPGALTQLVARDEQELLDSRESRLERCVVVVIGTADRHPLVREVLRPSTHNRYERILHHQVLPWWEKVPLSAVTHADVVAWVGELVSW